MPKPEIQPREWTYCQKCGDKYSFLYPRISFWDRSGTRHERCGKCYDPAERKLLTPNLFEE